MSAARRSGHAKVAALVALTMLVTVLGGGVGGWGASPVSAASGLGSGGEYHAVTPRIVLDARDGSKAGPIHQPLSSSAEGTRVSFPVTGIGGVPADTSAVLAVALHVSVRYATQPGDLVVFASGQSKIPPASSLAFSKRRSADGLVIARPSPTGEVSLAMRSADPGTANVRVTVVGWMSTTSSGQRGARLISTPMNRLLTKSDGNIPAGGVERVMVRGTRFVPDRPSVDAAVLNVTLWNARTNATGTFVSVLSSRPEGAPRIESLRAEKGAIVSTLVIVPLDELGRVFVYNHKGTAIVTVDVVGYMRSGIDASSRGGRIVPLDRPFRSFDTGSAAFGGVPLGPGKAERWDYEPFVTSLTYPDTGEAVGPVSALLGTFTGYAHVRQYPANPPSVTEMRVYPGGGQLPVGDNLVLPENQRMSNTVLGRLSADDQMSVYNSDGFTHYIYDLSAIVLEAP